MREDASVQMTELALQRLRRVVVATSRGPLTPVWRLFYRLGARLAGEWLARGGGAGVYLHERDEIVPGLSDVDLSVIAVDEGAVRAARARRTRMLNALAPLGRPIECFHVETRAAVAAACRSSVLTHGLDEDSGRGSIPMQNRPVPAGQMRGWRRVAGIELRPPAPAWPQAEHPGIAWLDVQFWWRHAFSLCTEPPAPWTAFSCVKLVAEPLRTLRWLEGGDWQGDRREILEDALGRRPGQERAIAHALWLLDRLERDPEPQLELALGALAWSSHAIGDEIAARASTAGHVEVGLTGDWDRSAPPLLDWWARGKDVGPWRRLAPMDGDPARPGAVRAAAMAFGPEISPALRDASLVVTPSPRPCETLRSAVCPAFDPVTFAVLDGSEVARFPELPGLSAQHCARRAVAERRPHGPSTALDRAEAFLESVRAGRPELSVTPEDAQVAA